MWMRILHRLTQSPDGVLHMPPALDTITATGTAIGTSALAALTIAPGDSLTIKNAALSSDAWILQLWADNQVSGIVRVRSAKMHDNVDAIRSRVLAGVVKPILPFGCPQKVYPQDTLAIELQGSGTAADIESVVLQVYYADLPGAAARLSTWDQIKGRVKNLVGVRNALVYPTTAGYGGSRAINADVDLLKANTDYAVLGMTTDAECAAICLRGPDTANLRVAVPGEPDLSEDTMQWFKLMAMHYNLPLVPVINSANKGATLLDAVSDENSATGQVTVWLAELG